jgi:hypothetical protein
MALWLNDVGSGMMEEVMSNVKKGDGQGFSSPTFLSLSHVWTEEAPCATANDILERLPLGRAADGHAVEMSRLKLDRTRVGIPKQATQSKSTLQRRNSYYSEINRTPSPVLCSLLFRNLVILPPFVICCRQSILNLKF